MSLSHLKSHSQGCASGIGIEAESGGFVTLSVERKSGFLHITSIGQCPSCKEDDDTLEGLRELVGSAGNMCLSLPPGSVTDMFQAIPATLRASAIEKHVQSQAHSIGSISDEQVIYDYQVMPGMQLNQRSLVISLVKEGVFEDAYHIFRQLDLDTHQVTSCGMAMVSSFFALEQRAAASTRPQVLLLLKEDVTLMSVVCNGGLQYAGSMLFGSRNLVVSLKNDGSTGRSLLKTELDSFLARWKESQMPSGDLPEYDMWLTGQSGSSLHQFSEMLSSIVGAIEMNVLALPGNMLPAHDDVPHPELIVPFGLALQSVGEGAVTLSLLPEQMKWLERKKREYKFLILAFVLLTVGLVLMLSGIMVHINREISAVTREQDVLDQCSSLLPQMNELHEKLYFQQRRMLPVTEAIYRTHCYLEALRLWQSSLKNVSEKEVSWGIYFADEFSFAISNVQNGNAEADEPTANERPLAPQATGLFEQPRTAGNGVNPRSRTINVKEMKTLGRIYIGGIVPLGASRYQTLKDVQSNLLNSGAYVNVDDHSELLTERFRSRFYSPWLDFLGGNAKALGSEYITFFVELPLGANFIRTEVLQQSNTKANP